MISLISNLWTTLATRAWRNWIVLMKKCYTLGLCLHDEHFCFKSSYHKEGPCTAVPLKSGQGNGKNQAGALKRAAGVCSSLRKILQPEPKWWSDWVRPCLSWVTKYPTFTYSLKRHSKTFNRRSGLKKVLPLTIMIVKWSQEAFVQFCRLLTQYIYDKQKEPTKSAGDKIGLMLYLTCLYHWNN